MADILTFCQCTQLQWMYCKTTKQAAEICIQQPVLLQKKYSSSAM